MGRKTFNLAVPESIWTKSFVGSIEMDDATAEHRALVWVEYEAKETGWFFFGAGQTQEEAVKDALFHASDKFRERDLSRLRVDEVISLVLEGQV